MSDNTKKICVGAIAGAFGAKGDIRLKSFTAVPTEIKNYSPLQDDQGQIYTIKKLTTIKGGFAAWIALICLIRKPQPRHER